MRGLRNIRDCRCWCVRDMNGEMILLALPSRNDLSKMATNHTGWSSKAG
jgi:hypothetical protein